MKKTVNVSESSEIDVEGIDSINVPVFAEETGRLFGMLVHEDRNECGWILRCGGTFGAYGHYSTLKKCIEKGIELGFIFFIEE